MRVLLLLVFGVSGATALIFETLWFHAAGLALGNSVWATSLVLAAFMAGLGLGNTLAMRFGQRFARPTRAYALLEVAIAVAGIALVYVLPHQGRVLAPLLGVDPGFGLAFARFAIAFAALLVPSTAMGLTLPLLTRALTTRDRDFGPVLGALYGANTAGAVLGAVLAETVLIEAFGIYGTAWIALGLNLVIACLAWLSDLHGPPEATAKTSEVPRLRSRAVIALCIAGASGFSLLALEVIWFRFLSLYVMSRSESFAVMLGVVLAGISVGGFLASRALARGAEPARSLAQVALAAGACCVISYAAAPLYLSPLGFRPVAGASAVALVALPLMFPVSLLSGVLFTLIGVILHRQLRVESAAAGALTLANTFGAAIGSLTAGFVLLPGWGVEASVFAIAGLYCLLGFGFAVYARDLRDRRSLAAAALALLALALFPWGAMRERHIPLAAARWSQGAAHRVSAVREGVAETMIYVNSTVLGEVHSTRLVTNALTMTANDVRSRRYMKLYSYWPIALHPNPRRALLISYGLGSTAKSLTDQPGLREIDIVDISRDVFEMSALVFSDDDDPLRDPRVRTHVEDGRYFLQASGERYDLITGEPPPPAAPGVANLYTREYFELVRAHLAEGGIFTYWLPIHSISTDTTRSILRAFCEVFADCSLWNGSGSDLMMVGTRRPAGAKPVSSEHFAALWGDPSQRAELEALGFETPEQLGALFIGDAHYLSDITRDANPAVDAWPKRIAGRERDSPGSSPLYRSFTDAEAARARFAESPFIAERWPARYHKASLGWFRPQQLMNDHFTGVHEGTARSSVLDIHWLLTETELRAPVMWLLRSDADALRIAGEGERPASPDQDYYLGVGAMADRDYKKASPYLKRAERSAGLGTRAIALRILALAMSGDLARAERLASSVYDDLGSEGRMADYWAGLETIFGITPTRSGRRAPLAVH